MPPAEIVRVNDARLRREFVMFPYRLYRRRGGQTVGRIAAILNLDHQRHHRDRSGFFGMFECADDPEAAGQLLAAAEAWLKERGCDAMRGPASFSLNGIAGLLVDGFDRPPAVLMAYNPPYYQRLLEGLGLRQAMRFFAYEVSRETIRFPRALERLQERLRRQGIVFRYFDLAHAARDMGIIIDLFNHAWSDNWGFVPTRLDEGLEDLKKMRPVVRPDLIIFAEKDGEPVGFSLSLAAQPEAHRRHPRHAHGRAQGVAADGHRPGLLPPDRRERLPPRHLQGRDVVDPGEQRADEPGAAPHQRPGDQDLYHVSETDLIKKIS